MESGIYIYCNKINGKKYVGQSINIQRRLKEHLKCHANQIIDRAISKYGIKNFYIIKIEYSNEELNEMERHYIILFNAFKNGYNCTTGGDSEFKRIGKLNKKQSKLMRGEGNPSAKITEKIVKDIRKMYKCGTNKNEIYKKYKHIISFNTVDAIVHNLTWIHI